MASVLAMMSIIALAHVTGCSGEKRSPAQTEQPRPAPAPRRSTIALDDPREDAQLLSVRDLKTGEIYALEQRESLFVLRSKEGAIDTLTIPDGGARTMPLTLFDSSFVRLSRIEGDISRFADLLVVAGGRLVWGAHLPEMASVAVPEGTAQYTVNHRFLRTPLSITGTESLGVPGVGGAPAREWSLRYDLRFDDSANVFYNVSIPLDSVPVADGRAISGQYPGIALRSGTIVFVDRGWHALSHLADLDPAEFSAGTVGMVLEGKGEWGDTLRPTR